jgi:SAM-dependent methyltransferase
MRAPTCSNGRVGETSDFERLWQLADLVSPMAVRVAATLRVADHVAAGATTAVALAERTGTHPDALARLLRHLVAIDVLSRDGERFGLTGLGECLREGNRGPLALDARSAIGRAHLAAVELLESVRTGRAAYPLVHGRGFWDDLAADPELGAGFDEFMGSGGHSDAFAAAYDWARAGHVVDVGGGSGAVLAALLRANPRLHGTLVDLPGPAGRARRRFAEAGLAGRTTVVAGSFFDPLPAGADAYLLSGVVHDWPDDEAAAILRRCAEAAGPTGRVLVVEAVLDSAGDLTGMTAFDLFMLVCCGGRERTLGELEALGRRAGLSLAGSTVSPPVTWLELVQGREGGAWTTT